MKTHIVPWKKSPALRKIVLGCWVRMCRAWWTRRAYPPKHLPLAESWAVQVPPNLLASSKRQWMSLMCKIVKLNGSAGNGVDVARRTDANSIQTHNKVAIWTLQKLRENDHLWLLRNYANLPCFQLRCFSTRIFQFDLVGRVDQWRQQTHRSLTCFWNSIDWPFIWNISACKNVNDKTFTFRTSVSWQRYKLTIFLRVVRVSWFSLFPGFSFLFFWVGGEVTS